MYRLTALARSLALAASLAVPGVALSAPASSVLAAGPDDAVGQPTVCQGLSFMLEEHGYDVASLLPGSCVPAALTDPAALTGPVGQPTVCLGLSYMLEEHGYDVASLLPASCD